MICAAKGSLFVFLHATCNILNQGAPQIKLGSRVIRKVAPKYSYVKMYAPERLRGRHFSEATPYNISYIWYEIWYINMIYKRPTFFENENFSLFLLWLIAASGLYNKNINHFPIWYLFTYIWTKTMVSKWNDTDFNSGS